MILSSNILFLALVLPIPLSLLVILILSLYLIHKDKEGNKKRVLRILRFYVAIITLYGCIVRFII